ncbi:choice-of-anchor E domain-containing protein [Nodularia sp. NIES-3585]|uniref:choice-of-anchor E domain-containing protein n=1 Tax=Nodularia sp. NIES-3585 TaxID=1973477 RepID=UPI000B5C6D5E|nr:choice-of-anchor E domain-containing protein [Nodularia sp. NIES-3585]GAX36195.1 hypothetical protein NIES3585_22210 [Nodularia sp. NIES-3585]
MTTKLLNSLAAATTLAGMLVTAGVANAASLTSTASTSLEFTDIVDSVLSIQKFNPSLGTLNSVTLDFNSLITGEAGFENRGARAARVTVKLAAEVNLTNSDLELSPPFPILPVNEQSYLVTAYDGVTDFGGTSGRTLEELIATRSTTKTFNSVPDLAVFTGIGNLDFLYTAIAESTVTGSGNLRFFVDTLAQADLTVIYDYDPKTVPEPSAALGIGLFAGIGLLSQRKKSWFKISNS